MGLQKQNDTEVREYDRLQTSCCARKSIVCFCDVIAVCLLVYSTNSFTCCWQYYVLTYCSSTGLMSIDYSGQKVYIELVSWQLISSGTIRQPLHTIGVEKRCSSACQVPACSRLDTPSIGHVQASSFSSGREHLPDIRVCVSSIHYLSATMMSIIVPASSLAL